MSLLGPAPDEVEVTVLGPGVGESVIIHLGHGRWIVVDSCVLPESAGRAAALHYLEAELQLDVADCVDLVVSTHWHDDHTAGLSELLAACSGAVFACTLAMREPEFRLLVAAGGDSALGSIAGTTQMHRTVEELKRRRKDGADHAQAAYGLVDRELLVRPGPPRVSVRAVSPSDRDVAKAVASVLPHVPSPGRKRRAVLAPSKNHAAVALWITVGDVHVLLGADLEKDPDPYCGWQSVLVACAPREERAGLLKVPHHGSENADEPLVWQRLLHPNPVAIIAPFRQGDVRRPTLIDVARVRGRTSRGYLTASRDLPLAARARDSPDVLRPRQAVSRGISFHEPPAPGARITARTRFDSPHAWAVEPIGSAWAFDPWPGA